MTDKAEQRLTADGARGRAHPVTGPPVARQVAGSRGERTAWPRPGELSAGAAAVADVLWVLVPVVLWVVIGEALLANALTGGAARPIPYPVLLLNMGIRILLVWRLIAWRLEVHGQRSERIGWTSRNIVLEGLLGVPAAVVLLVVSAAMTAWLLFRWPDLLSVVYSNREAGFETFPPMHVWQWALLAVLAATIEEPFFRGLLQQRLTVALGSPLWGVIVQAALFGAPHLYEGPTAALTIFYLGLILGGLTWWRRSLVPAIVAHSLFNLANFTLIYFLRGYGL